MSDGLDLEDLLLAHAAGTLPWPLAVLVRCHLQLRPQSRQQMRLYEHVAGLCLEQLPPVPFDPARRACVLEQLSSEVCDARPPKDPPGSQRQSSPLPLSLARLSWRATQAGVAEAPLPASEDSVLQTRLLRLDPGCGPGRHGHPGREFVLVLAGQFCDEFGCYGPGDVVICAPGIEHTPIATGHTPCLCLEVRERKPKAKP